MQIVAPGDGATIGASDAPQIEAMAYDPNLGTSNGQGIAHVIFSIITANGTTVASATENQAAYCLFGGNGPCNTWPGGQWNSLAPGSYTITATAHSSQGKPSVSVSISFTRE